MENGHTVQVHEHGFVRLIDSMGTDTRVVEAARLSYRSPSKGAEADAKLIGYLLKNKHVSPFEMCKITFNVKMPIFVMRQWVRHRMQNLNEVSARYTELPNEHYLPHTWRVQAIANKQSSDVPELHDADWHQGNTNTCHDSYASSYLAYERLLANGVAREMARIVLPVGIYTEIYSCWDLNNLLKFFALRDDAHAQAEIQDYARPMKEITRALFPTIMAAYDELRGPNG